MCRRSWLTRSIVSSVLAWEDVKDPPAMMSAERGGLVTAITEIRDGKLVMIVDVEKILADTTGYNQGQELYRDIEVVSRSDFRVLYADDSGVARDQIARTLDQIGLPHTEARNGAQAWQKLNEFALEAEKQQKDISDMVKCIVTDEEMPKMDGYVLTQKIKEDDRFQEYSGDHAFLVVGPSQSFTGDGGWGRYVRAKISSAGAGRRDQLFSDLSILKRLVAPAP